MIERSFDTGALTRAASDTFAVRRVFGDAYEHAGRLVVPVARVTGATGSGGGSGGDDLGAGGTETAHGTGDGGGGGFAARVRPLGVMVVDDTGVRWKPAVDVNRVVLGHQLVVAVVATVWAVAWAVRRR